MRKFWIQIRLSGWGIIFISFVLQIINLIDSLIDEQTMNLMNGLLGSIGTFCVMIGYLMLVSNEP